MTRLPNKYQVDPSWLKGQQDIVGYVRDVISRLSASDTSLRIGHTAIEDGDLTIRNGDILVSETDGTVVMRIKHGAVPEIRFFPLGETDDYQATLFAYDDNFDPLDPNQALFLGIEKVAGPAVDGGKVLLSKDYAVLSWQPDDGGVLESYIWVNAHSQYGNPQVFVFRGKWPDQFMFDGDQGIYPGTIGISAGFTSWTHTYAATFNGTICPLVTLINSTVVSWMVTATSTSSFTTSWSGTAAKTLNFWNFRI